MAVLLSPAAEAKTVVAIIFIYDHFHWFKNSVSKLFLSRVHFMLKLVSDCFCCLVLCSVHCVFLRDVMVTESCGSELTKTRKNTHLQGLMVTLSLSHPVM